MQFAAASTVVLFHLGYLIRAPAGSPTMRAAGVRVPFPEFTFLSFGRAGVEVFFVLSGFIIARSAERSTAFEFFEGVPFGLPAVWIVATITLAVAAITAQPVEQLLTKYLRSLILFPIGAWIDDVYWTLPIEVVSKGVVFMALTMSSFEPIPTIMAAIGRTSTALCGC